MIQSPFRNDEHSVIVFFLFIYFIDCLCYAFLFIYFCHPFETLATHLVVYLIKVFLLNVYNFQQQIREYSASENSSDPVPCYIL